MAHDMQTHIVSRRPNVWEMRCACGQRWRELLYESVEDRWREHVHAETGTLIKPGGNTKIERWKP